MGATSTESQLLAQVISKPEDLEARSVLADYWEEQGSPRADFVRAQLRVTELRDAPVDQLGRHEALLEAESCQQRLESQHRKRWAGDARRDLQRFGFRNGFLEHADMKEGIWKRACTALTSSHPIRSLRVRTARSDSTLGVNRPAVRAALKSMRSLAFLPDRPLPLDVVGALNDGVLTRIESLRCSMAAYREITHSQSVDAFHQHLRELSLSGDILASDANETKASHESLRVLQLEMATTPALERMRRRFPRVEELTLKQLTLNNAGQLLMSWKDIKRFRISQTVQDSWSGLIQDEFVGLLQHWALRELELSGSNARLAELTLPCQLERLHLMNNQWTNVSLTQLLGGLRWLRDLDISGRQSLYRGSTTFRTTIIDSPEAQLRRAQLEELLDTDLQLGRLVVNKSSLGDMGIDIFCGRPERLQTVYHLELRDNGLTDAAATRLEQLGPWDRLATLDLRENHFSEAAKQRLRAAFERRVQF